MLMCCLWPTTSNAHHLKVQASSAPVAEPCTKRSLSSVLKNLSASLNLDIALADPATDVLICMSPDPLESISEPRRLSLYAAATWHKVIQIDPKTVRLRAMTAAETRARQALAHR